MLGLIDYTPGWANGGAATKFYPPLDNAAFAAYASHLAAHYAPMGVQLGRWERGEHGRLLVAGRQCRGLRRVVEGGL